MRLGDEQQFEIDGVQLSMIVGDEHVVGVYARAHIRVPMVGIDAAELTSELAVSDALTAMAKSIHRRGVKPKGRWIVVRTPVDWPNWRHDIDPTIADEAGRKLVELNGHIIVYYLFDSADMTIDLDAVYPNPD